MEALNPNQLNSPKAKDNIRWVKLFNKLYKLNLPTNGDWTNPEFNKTMERYLKEKNIPIWVCKKGDGFCPEGDEGSITTQEIKRLRDSIAQDSAKPQTGKINTTHDKSYDYKLENEKYYYSLKGQNKWIEAKGKGLSSIKTNVKF